ncbi:MAG: RNA methyltransferase [Lachnospiraceae bacterium]|nr:RNA methyltransferase [Lachnospiraceae bacterium]
MITSITNPRIKRVIKLQKQAKARALEQAFVIEGIKLFREAPQDLIKEIYLTQDFGAKYLNEPNHLKEKLLSSSYEIVSDICFERMAQTKTPQGIICLLSQLDWRFSVLPCEDLLYLILEDLSDPGNLGTMFRTAEAAGVTAIILNGGCADVYNPKTVRSTMGSIFRVPFTYAEDLGQVIAELKNQDIKIYATSLENAESYDKCDYRAGTAFIIGNEAHGLCPTTKALATQSVTVPMLGEVESLNAATAASALLFEAARQRRSLN